MDKKKHVLFLFSDTGGGHRSASEAIIEAIHARYGDSVTTEMVDIFKQYAPRPLNRMPDWYPYMVKAPDLWGASFKISDGRARARAITATFWPVVARYARQVINQHPSDLIVSVHPFATTFILKALGNNINRSPFVTVVTDMVTTHALWFDQRADLICVPTDIARQRALEFGMPPSKVVTVGQPIAAKYCVPSGDKVALRKSLGWPENKFTVVAVGGGDGMGPLAQTARAIGESGLDLNLVVVAGRNERLRQSLQALNWPIPIFIYGFTRDLPDFMRAADVLVTKAGPGTIAEALAANLPLILYARLPGQEDGNVAFVRYTNTGVWAPTPQRVVSTLRLWHDSPEEREKVVEACKRMARPEASNEIARIIGEQLGFSS